MVVAKPLAGSAGLGDRVVDLRVERSSGTSNRPAALSLERVSLRDNLWLQANTRLTEKNIEAATGFALAA